MIAKSVIARSVSDAAIQLTRHGRGIAPYVPPTRHAGLLRYARNDVLWLGIICVYLFTSNIASAAEVKEVITPKGLTAWLVEEHALPLVSVKIAFRESGVAHDPDGKEGRASMTASMMMEGSGDMDSRAFYQALESSAIQLNMDVDDDHFTASLECLSEHKTKAFSYLGLALNKPRFDADALERVRAQTLAAIIEREQNPGYILHNAWEKLAFGNHPYAKQELGVPASVKALSAGDLRFVAQHYLTKENMVISAVGDITPAELSQLLDSALGDLPAQFAPDTTVKDTELTASALVTVDFDIPQTMVAFGIQGIKRSDPDYFSAYVMNEILGAGGGYNSRLNNEIREKRGLAYYAASQLRPLTHAASWQGSFATRREQADKAKEVLAATIKDFVATGPTDKEMHDAKEYLTGSFVLSLDSNADIASFLLSMQLNHLGRDYLDKRNSLVQAVSKQDVHAMAKRLINPDKLLIVTVGKPSLTPAPATP